MNKENEFQPNSSKDSDDDEMERGHLLVDTGTRDVTVENRPIWARKVEYLLALIGYCVGIGTLWRFPYVCLNNGGGAFLVPFLFFLFTSGVPLYYLEVNLGQFSGKSPLAVWTICPLFKGLGVAMVIISVTLSWYYGMIIAWSFCFLYYSFYSTLPWRSCDNKWNTPNCVLYSDLASTNQSFAPFLSNITSVNSSAVVEVINRNGSMIMRSELTSSAQEFWRYGILNVSTGIEDLGSIQGHLVLALIISYVVCFLCIVKGTHTVGKVVYVTAGMPYFLLLILFIRSMTLEGSVDGIIAFLNPDFSRLLDYKVWIVAAVQVFYSLGPAWGGIITMASFNKFDSKGFRDSLIVTIVLAGTCIFCGLVVFSIMGFAAKEAGKTIEEVTEAGPGLVFVAYPEVLSKLPLPQLWSVLFFTTLIFAGLDTLFGCLETVIGGVIDVFPRQLRGNRRYPLMLVVFLVFCILGLLLTTQGGIFIYQIIDWYASAFVVFFVSFSECLVVGWIYGAERFSRDITVMTGDGIGVFMRLIICIIIPVFMIIAFISSVLGLSPPTYKGYVYPSYIGGVGVLIGMFSVAPIFIAAVWVLYKQEGSLMERLRQATQPIKWLPREEKACQGYKHYQYEKGISNYIKTNLIGTSLKFRK